MGGLKRKIPTDKKIEKKESKSVAFSKRRRGLYSKTAQLCVLSGSQAAILATPPCSKSNVSFYSFGHSSVDNVVSAFLKNQRPREDHLGSEFWWNDELLAESEDPEELSEAAGSMSRMIQNLKGLRSKALAKKMKGVVLDKSQTLNLQSNYASSSCIHEGVVKNFKEEDVVRRETLGFQPSLASLCIQDVSRENNVEEFVSKSEENDQIVACSESNNNGLLGNLDGFNLEDDFIDIEMNSEGFITTKLEMDDVSTNQYSSTGSEGAEEGAMVVIHSNKDNNEMVAVSDSNKGDLYGCNQEFDIDQIFDLVACTEDLSMNSEMNDDVSMMMNQTCCANSEAVEDGGVVLHKELEQDNLRFSDFFSGLFFNGEV
ncbi:unnamed protein product [Eruca vesicaria subsp. sativa]|uniref:MADS-box domain-containing protein n=1 Tax=Eruca vesicaria subsp. sativa TaxID=29727 RepID=A0ABC8LA74_ERUVS|nr:unnamed protein product [Eruca vesicaria subsp. sativa]